jgi:hypothetical protein
MAVFKSAPQRSISRSAAMLALNRDTAAMLAFNRETYYEKKSQSQGVEFCQKAY